ncbi:hypothetical protein [Stutzerimonas xanthomarina]|jgi:hypothetical protein|uniref:hypothetical protein n=1 Tax=Stutzerimonas xanthomarina TaxID=271420 RepID=UPI001160F6AC|nr:hypothetical protein [Stutzerimonas xanthomarina]MCP9339431.1 hypothetical protein [Stutzerimonas xanthomarina]|tara:strand:- start:272 stop:538 length:267 start_codon:yes stop_codon:yes gene_type:complete
MILIETGSTGACRISVLAKTLMKEQARRHTYRALENGDDRSGTAKLMVPEPLEEKNMLRLMLGVHGLPKSAYETRNSQERINPCPVVF